MSFLTEIPSSVVATRQKIEPATDNICAMDQLIRYPLGKSNSP